MSPQAIRVQSLTKRYRSALALADVSFEVAPGEIVALVGPNGAGKSTVFKILLGIAHATRGEASVFGIDVRKAARAVRERVGSLPGDLELWRRWRGGETLDFLLSFHPRPDRRRALALAERFGLPLGRRVKHYSTGMRQQLGLIQALACGAEVLLLDEPSKGLDPTAQAILHEEILGEQRRGRTLLLSSHRLDEVERLADRVLFLDRGRLLPDERIRAVRRRFAREVLVVLEGDASTRLGALASVEAVEETKEGLRVRIAPDADPARALADLAALGPRTLVYNRPTLQEIYRTLYLEENEGNEP